MKVVKIIVEDENGILREITPLNYQYSYPLEFYYSVNTYSEFYSGTFIEDILAPKINKPEKNLEVKW